MFLFKLNPLGDPLSDEFLKLRWSGEFEVTVTTWPPSRGNCKQKLFFKSLSKPPLNESNCFGKMTVPNAKQTTFEKYRQFTLINEYNLRIVVGEDKFRENILHNIIKQPYTIKKYSSDYCNETYRRPFEKKQI